MKALLNMATDTFPDDGIFYLLRAENAIQNSDLEEAKALYMKVRDLSPLDASGYAGLSKVYAAKEDVESSLDYARAALARNRNDLFICQGMVWTLRSIGRDEEAAEQLQDCIDRCLSLVKRGTLASSVANLPSTFVNSARRDCASMLDMDGRQTEAEQMYGGYIHGKQLAQQRDEEAAKLMTLFGTL